MSTDDAFVDSGTSPPPSDPLTLARDLISLGAPVFVMKPCHRCGGDGCAKDVGGAQGKFMTPCVGGYVTPRFWQTKKADPKVLELWAPGCALAMVCGVVFDVVDTDVQNDGAAGRAGLELPTVFLTVGTPSTGTHEFVAASGLAKAPIAPGVDYQAGADAAGRGFVFLPGTLKTNKVSGETKQPYVVKDRTVLDAALRAVANGMDVGGVVRRDEAWVARVGAARNSGRTRKAGRAGVADAGAAPAGKSSEWAAVVGEIGKPIPHGQHDHTLTSFAAKLRTHGATHAEAYALVQQRLGDCVGVGTYAEDWATAKVDSAWRNIAGPCTCESPFCDKIHTAERNDRLNGAAPAPDPAAAEEARREAAEQRAGLAEIVQSAVDVLTDDAATAVEIEEATEALAVATEALEALPCVPSGKYDWTGEAARGGGDGSTWRPRKATGKGAPKPDGLTRTDGFCGWYSGKVNGLIGHSEVGKSWVAIYGCVQEMVLGERALYIDFEDDVDNVVARFKILGATDAMLDELFTYIGPEENLRTNPCAQVYLEEQLDLGPAIIICDAWNAAMVCEGMDTTTQADVITWSKRFLRQLARSGAKVVVLDHVPKDSMNVTKGGIGPQAKRAEIDGCQLRADEGVRLAPGAFGYIVLSVDKDRNGGVRGHSADKETFGVFYMDAPKPDDAWWVDGGEPPHPDAMRAWIGPAKTKAELKESKTEKAVENAGAVDNKIVAAIADAQFKQGHEDGITKTTIETIVGGDAVDVRRRVDDLQARGIIQAKPRRGRGGGTNWTMVGDTPEPGLTIEEIVERFLGLA